jgi:hypothetical protein
MLNLRKNLVVSKFNLVVFLTAFTLFSIIGSVDAQNTLDIVAKEKKFDVEVKQGNLLNVESAELSKVVVRENKNLTELFQLSFFVPLEFENLLPKSKVMLTAYNENGSVKGMKVWSGLVVSKESKITEKGIPFNFELGSNFEDSFRFGLSIIESSDKCNSLAGDCTDCADLAVAVCGAGKVASVKCGRSKDRSSCEFTCKP